MRELEDIVRRLIALRRNLGEQAYRLACQEARVAVGRAALKIAEDKYRATIAKETRN